MKNKYEVRGDTTAIIVNSPKHGIVEVIISTSDLERVTAFPNSWIVTWNKDVNSFYCSGKMNSKMYMIHRWIMDAPRDKVVDHINHDTCDNRRENLRIVTHAENMQNRRPNKHSNSGIRGVSWKKKTGKWDVSIWVNKRLIHIGCFSDLAQAEKSAIAARQKYHPFSVEVG